jgi:uncharacterized lipoprotein YehR (DUF1307 family)
MILPIRMMRTEWEKCGILRISLSPTMHRTEILLTVLKRGILTMVLHQWNILTMGFCGFGTKAEHNRRKEKMKKSSKTWLITGCSSGLGRAFAQEVLKNGYNAVVTSRNTEDIQDIIKNYPETSLGLALDVTNKEQAKEVIKQAGEKFKSIDVLVNTAGYGYRSAVEEADRLKDSLCTVPSGEAHGIPPSFRSDLTRDRALPCPLPCFHLSLTRSLKREGELLYGCYGLLSPGR